MPDPEQAVVNGDDPEAATLGTLVGGLVPPGRPSMSPTARPLMSPQRVRVIAGLLGVLCVLAVLGIVALWPAASDDQKALSSGAAHTFQHLPLLHIRLTVDVTQLLMAVLAGMLGGSVHAMTVLAARVGNQDEEESWWLWYLFAPVVGGALAFVLIAAVQGGLLTNANSASAINLYGLVAIAAAAGLFSRKVTDQLLRIISGIHPPSTAQGRPTSPGGVVPALAAPPRQTSGTPPPPRT